MADYTGIEGDRTKKVRVNNDRAKQIPKEPGPQLKKPNMTRKGNVMGPVEPSDGNRRLETAARGNEGCAGL